MADWEFIDVILSDATNQSTSSHKHKGRLEEEILKLSLKQKARKMID